MVKEPRYLTQYNDRLQTWRAGIQFPAGARDFPLFHSIQTGFHPASYPMGIGGSFPGDKTAGLWNWPLISN
jgi:hypothetical protein